MRSGGSTLKILIRVGITVDPGDGNGLTTGDEEEGESARSEGVH